MYLFYIVQKKFVNIWQSSPLKQNEKRQKNDDSDVGHVVLQRSYATSYYLIHKTQHIYIYPLTHKYTHKYTLLFSINFTNVYSGEKSPLRCRSLIEKLHNHTLLHIHTIEIHSSHTNTSTHLYTYTHLHTQYTRVNTRHTRVKVLYSYATPMCGRIDVLECEVQAVIERHQRLQFDYRDAP